MKLRSLGIQNFRNIGEMFLECSGKAFLFTGTNGEGKTNILEAIYSLLRGKSFRTYSHRTDWIRQSSQPLDRSPEVRARLENSLGYVTDIRLLINAKGRWETRVSEKKVTPKFLRERLPVVVFSPEDHSIIRSGPESRRDYMDDLFSDICPGYIELQEKFEKSLHQRNELLKKVQRSQNVSSSERQAWEQVYVDTAMAFWTLRFELWPFFRNRVQNLNHSLFEKWNEKISVKYQMDRSLLERPPQKSELVTALTASYEADVATGWTHHGPHRDDFQILIGDLESRGKASQGQARMLAFALKWLQAQWIFDEQKEAPLFLVDDFSSEFDASNRKQLMQLVNSLGSQVFLTGTEASLVDWEANIEYTQYIVRNGTI